MTPAGHLVSVEGAVVRARLDLPVALGEGARVGEAQLLAEVIALDGHIATAQVYEDTSGLSPGMPFYAIGEPLSVELGPGLLGTVFDGIQRPLEALAAAEGDFLGRGQRLPALDRDRLWAWTPCAVVGEALAAGAIVGVVPETASLAHRVLVPPGLGGRLVEIAPAGPRRVADAIAKVELASGRVVELTLMQRWHVRTPRPFRERLSPATPLITAQRVLDTFFPIARGSSAGMPGGFGTGKTILQHQLVKWANADVIVFVGCGERGNEMTRMLRELPELVDPRSGRPLAERTVMVANTSNMPVSAREASLYTGVTIAEHYRDMGYHVALLADSTSRWAEALREISGRLGEMPAEEGYPPYLSSRLAAYYERAGRVTTLGGSEGSVTLISAISPPGGDPAEPVTRHTHSFARVFWTLDRDLAAARVFPAVSVTASYAEVSVELEAWWSTNVASDWGPLRRQALALLDEAARLEATARLIGVENLPEPQRFVLLRAELLREGFLMQNAFDAVDSACSPQKQVRLLRALLAVGERGARAVERGASPEELSAAPALTALARARVTVREDALPQLDALVAEADRQIAAIEGAHVAVAS